MTFDSDAVVDLVGFARRLRADGLAVDVTRVATALRALRACRPLDDRGVYWSTRLTLCSRREDLPAFDAAYAAWFGVPAPATPVPARSRAGETEAATADRADADGDGRARSASTRAGFAERLAVPSPWTLSSADRTETTRLVEAFTGSASPRATMRRVPGGRTSIDVSRTARAMMRNGGEPVRLRYQRRHHARRRLALLLDVSRSMRAYRGLLLRFAYAAVAAAPTRTEVFTIGTRLDRITPELRLPDPQAAMHALAGRRSDWDGGTRLGPTVTAFVHRWGGRRAVRSADVVIVSDGWERADPAPLVQHVARLSRLAHRVIWGDPEAGRPDFVPQAPGLVDCLPYVDLVAAHDAEALRSLAGRLAGTPCGPRCRRHPHRANRSARS